ncbi:UDP-N-acetylglucosamine--N-acetylmuramyl-(pentapeptide) pyrophosphoryl-undecaprenol N-acetylglucosamine transferase MurG [Gottschalkia acidurici 9a]|uniref:UDP-N-acetylglucosamine--N-acetylmuramyl-(pentapeptide) pyrophosphoryl-undecaprenol N-acetylglucosamine transferase n=1 Tax=Gottschalkia acidurici (strain ATCC 7906 / DSM 604 / BCRC 14475 / CIP 104303 / KCTC 5404 / NCIMB 10678 / 9a) TaxID=1128398 RepID=K0AZV0_GOTA9|nr:undecaprenyldiphospho-muramoylpentapeptide beta-N-acetylglucosaminyltransferase [Gottschalkia acidurici]AFS78312.1 UDP-N-acetylglucosamine--N-acetylmuramyl-(pentapeptide) pyrophosphoryl-undecaprenol N-acetylglucosamine transferase MurG [Gottschalkia acidurici 9a]
MKVVITGGGTGGHIYPALSIARKIKDTYKDADILYVGTEKGLESKLVPKEGFNFKSIRVKGFSRKLSKDTIKSIKELLLGLNDARKVLKEFSPDVVIGTGGYVCGPLVLLASLKRIPTLIHEQNAFPGVTNKILSKFVDIVAGSFEESKSRFNNSEKVKITGNPIRQDILNIDKESAYSDLNIDKEKTFILCFGGSGGQESLNDSILRFIHKNINNKDIQILHVTGERYYEQFLNGLENMGVAKLNENIRVVPYFYDMPKALNIADIAITSAGAITIAELTAVGVPSILIPKAYTAENHQEYNARALEKEGAGVVILEKDLTHDVLCMKIEELLSDKNKLGQMAQNSKRIGILDADKRILDLINEIIDN